MLPGTGERDVTWTAKDELLTSANTKIYVWRPGDKAWREICDVAEHRLGTVTRLAMAPDYRSLAIVVMRSPASGQ